MSSSAPTPGSLLPDIVTELNIYVQWAEAAQDPVKLAAHGEEICIQYRAMAICLMAQEGMVADFFHWLLHSPITRRFHLNKAIDAGLGGTRAIRTSFVDPVLDAIAARQWKLAQAISELAAADWIDGSEYEDDFCYGDFLRRVLRPEDDGIERLLVRWRRALEGGRDHRLDVAETLVAGDAVEFENNLRDLLRAREARARKLSDPKTQSPVASELSFFPNRWIAIEGLALLAIAERRGMTIADELDACPRPLREGSYGPFVSRGYPNRGLD